MLRTLEVELILKIFIKNLLYARLCEPTIFTAECSIFILKIVFQCFILTQRAKVMFALSSFTFFNANSRRHVEGGQKSQTWLGAYWLQAVV